MQDKIEPLCAGAARALELMREALALLDKAGADVAACHLQYAIDVLDLFPAVFP